MIAETNYNFSAQNQPSSYNQIQLNSAQSYHQHPQHLHHYQDHSSQQQLVFANTATSLFHEHQQTARQQQATNQQATYFTPTQPPTTSQHVKQEPHSQHHDPNYQANYHQHHYAHATPANNYTYIDYDVDDDFSDILSAPPTPLSSSSASPMSLMSASSGSPLSIASSFSSSSSLSPATSTTMPLFACNHQQRHASLSHQQFAPKHRSSPIHLWEFLKDLLREVELSPSSPDLVISSPTSQLHSNDSSTPFSPANKLLAASKSQQVSATPSASQYQPTTIIRWLDKSRGVFKIEDSVRVAKLWGKRKNKPKMNYDKLSRSIRQYYKKGIMKKTDRSQRLVYQFCAAYCQ